MLSPLDEDLLIKTENRIVIALVAEAPVNSQCNSHLLVLFLPFYSIIVKKLISTYVLFMLHLPDMKSKFIIVATLLTVDLQTIL